MLIISRLVRFQGSFSVGGGPEVVGTENKAVGAAWRRQQPQLHRARWVFLASRCAKSINPVNLIHDN